MPEGEISIDAESRLDAVRDGASTPPDRPQFALRDAMLWLSVAAVWFAAIRSEWFRFGGWFIPLILFARYFVPTIRFVYRIVQRFASHGRSPLWSGLLAAAIGSFGAFVYLSCLVGIATDSTFERSNAMIMFSLVIQFIMTALAVVAVITKSCMFVGQSFGRRMRDIPDIVVCHAADGATGGIMFLISCFLVASTSRVRFELATNPILLVVGVFIGLLTSGNAVNAHFDFLDTTRRKSTPPTSPTFHGESFEA
jgi:hypothetical protein